MTHCAALILPAPSWSDGAFLKRTRLEEAALPGGPALYTQAAVWSVGVGCQPLCVCKSLGNGSWMGAGSLFVCILQSFSLGRSGPLPLLASLNAIMPVGTASVSLRGTFPAAHTAVSLLLKEKSTWHSCTSSCFPFSSLSLSLSFWLPYCAHSPALPVLLSVVVISILQREVLDSPQRMSTNFVPNPGLWAENQQWFEVLPVRKHVRLMTVEVVVVRKAAALIWEVASPIVGCFYVFVLIYLSIKTSDSS